MHRLEARVTILLVVAQIALGTSLLAGGQMPVEAVRPVVSHPAELASISTAASNESARGDVRGTTVDASGGVLPGVTVTVATRDGRDLGSVVTGLDGAFVVSELPIGPAVISFHLSGFADARVDVDVRDARDDAGSRRGVIRQRLDLPAMAERVTVRADPLPPPPPPRPAAAPVPEHDQASVCSPARAEAMVPTFGTIRSRRDDETKVLFAAGEALLVDGGTTTGLAVGQNYVVRRQYPTALRAGRQVVVMGEHSAGLLQIVEVEPDVATAVVVYACDEIMRGDYLAPFAPEVARAPEPAGTPVFEQAARLLFADAGQPIGVPGRMVIVDRGARQDARVGQRLTIFRRSRFGDRRPIVVGDAVVVAVRDASSTVRIERATDAIFLGEQGDWAAPQAR